MTTDTKRFDIEVVDKIAPEIDNKIRGIAKVATDAAKALHSLNEMLSLAGSNTSITQLLSNLGLADIKLATAQARLAKELEGVNLLHTRSEILIRKEISALEALANKAASIKPVANIASNIEASLGINSLPKSAQKSSQSFGSATPLEKQFTENTQAEFNRLLSVNQLVAKSAKDSASAFIEQGKAEATAARELAGYSEQAQLLKARLYPLAVAQKHYAEQVATADALLQRNLITTQEHSKATSIASQQFAQSERAIKTMGGSAGLAGHQMINLGYQLNDVVVSLYSGQKPLTVFIQQGSQIAQIFGSSNVGVLGGLKAVGSYLGSFLTIGRVAFGGVASAAAIGAVAFNSYLTAQKALETATKGIGSYAHITADNLELISNKAAIAGKISISASRDMTTAFLVAGNANKDTLLQAVSLTKDLSATLGLSLEDGKKQLEGLFSDPVKGSEELNKKLNFLDANTLKYIKTLVEQGDKEKAVGVVLDALKPKLLDHGESVTGIGRAWDALKIIVENSGTSIGSAVNRAFSATPKVDRISMFAKGFADLNAVVNDVDFNKTVNQTTSLVDKFDDFNSKILNSKNAIVLLDKSIDAVTIRMRQTNDVAKLEGFKEQLSTLNKSKDAYVGMKTTLELFGNTQTRLGAINAIDLALINAKTTAERAGLSSQRERLNLAGSELSLTEQDMKAKQVAAVIFATVAKQRNDELYTLREENKLIGLLGPQRQLEAELLSHIISAKVSGNALNEKEIADRRELLAVKQNGALQDAANNTIYEETSGALMNINRQLVATNIMYDKGAISSENYANRLVKLGLAATDLKLKFGDANYIDVTNASLGKLVSNYEGVLPGLSNSFGSFFQSVNDGFADSIGKAIVMSESLEDALHSVAQNALAGLISSLIKVGIQYAVNAALGESLNAGVTASSVAQAGVVALAWAPAAAAVSLATSGANAIGADAALIQTNLLSSLLAAPKGFAIGGYVGGIGTGTSDSIPAMLSNGEFIINSKATNDNLPLLNAINSGMNVNSFVPNSGNKNSSSAAAINVTVINNGSSKISVEQLSPTEIRIIAQDEAKRAVVEHAPKVIASNVGNPNSQVSKALNANLTASRRR